MTAQESTALAWRPPLRIRCTVVSIDFSSPCCSHTDLHRHGASRAVVVHEDAQHVWDELRQVELELAAQRHHDLLNQQDNGVLHGVVGRPVLLRVATQTTYSVFLQTFGAFYFHYLYFHTPRHHVIASVTSPPR